MFLVYLYGWRQSPKRFGPQMQLTISFQPSTKQFQCPPTGAYSKLYPGHYVSGCQGMNMGPSTQSRRCIIWIDLDLSTEGLDRHSNIVISHSWIDLTIWKVLNLLLNKHNFTSERLVITSFGENFICCNPQNYNPKTEKYVPKSW